MDESVWDSEVGVCGLGLKSVRDMCAFAGV